MDARTTLSVPAVLVLAVVSGGPVLDAAGSRPLPHIGLASPSATGEIAGRVTDAAGTALEGVSVTASSPALSGTRRVTTTSAGTYRIGQLPAGVYSVALWLVGFAAAERREVVLDDGACADVNARLTELSEPDVQSRLVDIGAPVLIARSGGGAFAARAGIDYTDWRLQSDNLTPVLKAQGAGFGNPVRRNAEARVEMGGPIRRDRAWWWGAASRSVVERGVIGFYKPACLAQDGTPIDGAEYRARCMNGDAATTTTADVKLQYLWTPAHRSTVFWGAADTRRPNRGASAFDRPEHTSRQSDLSLAHPVQVLHQWALSDRFVVDGSFTFASGRFVLDFQDPGLADVQGAYDRHTLVSSRSGVRAGASRPVTEFEATGRVFASDVLGGDHSTGFGVEFRDAPRRQWDRTGGGAVAVFDSGSGTPVAYQAQIVRDGVVNLAARRYSAFIQESYRRGRVSIDAGLRFDRQDDSALESTIPANRVLPELLPAVRFPGADSGVVYNDVSPRVAAVWSVTGDARTVVKASAARHWGSGNTSSARLQPTGQTRLVYWWNDLDRDGFVQSGELDLERGPTATPSANYDPANPAAVRSPATVDPRLRNHVTDEFTAGLEHQLARHWRLRAVYVGRKTRQIQASFPVNPDGSLVDSSTFEPVSWTPSNCPPGAVCPEVTYYKRAEALPARTVLRNDGEFIWRHGLDLTVHKRLAGGWMLDVSVAWNASAWHVPQPTFDYTNPTNVSQRQGTEYSVPAPHWVVEASGSARLPWGFTTAASFTTQQGQPYSRGVTSPNRGVLGSTVVDSGRYGTERYPATSRFDWRINRAFRAGRATIVPVLNVANLLNSNAVVARNRVQNTSSANDVTRVLAPRLVHVGVSVTF